MIFTSSKVVHTYNKNVITLLILEKFYENTNFLLINHTIINEYYDLLDVKKNTQRVFFYSYQMGK